jgi:hypothetical protein
MLLRKNELNTASTPGQDNEKDIMLDIKYVRESCALIAEALKHGCDVMQMANGDVITTELKPVTIQYVWDNERGKLVRGPHTHKPPKVIPRKSRARKDVGVINKSLAEVVEFADF